MSEKFIPPFHLAAFVGDDDEDGAPVCDAGTGQLRTFETLEDASRIRKELEDTNDDQLEIEIYDANGDVVPREC